jgi:hypothetical protein
MTLVTTNKKTRTITYLTDEEHLSYLLECEKPAAVVCSVRGYLKTQTRQPATKGCIALHYGYKFPVTYSKSIKVKPEDLRQYYITYHWVENASDATVFTKELALHEASLKAGAYIQMVPALTTRQMARLYKLEKLSAATADN